MIDSGASPFRSVRYAERSRLRTAPRLAVVAVVVVLVLVLGAYVGVWAVVNRQVRGTAVAGLARPDPAVTNLLVISAPTDGGDPDGIAVVQLSDQRERPAVLVLPAALELDVPDLGALTLADAPSVGGTALLVEQVAGYTGLDLHHYVRVDREALARLVDASGGLDDCPAPDVDPCPRLIGDDVRERLAPPVDAVTGVERVVAHADVAGVLAAEIDRTRTVLDPRRALRLAAGWSATLTTDVDPGVRDVRALADVLVAIDPEDVDVRILPGLVDDGRISVAPETAAVLLQAFADVAPLPAGVGLEAPRQLVPADVALEVRNGAGVRGSAGAAAEALAAQGFEVVEVGNADRFDPRMTTEVAHREQDLPLAELVLEALPGAEAVVDEDLPPGVDVLVTVGAEGAP